MYETHKTASGQVMLICQMEDSHLENMIKLLSKKMLEAKSVLTNSSNLDPVTSVLAGIQTEDIIYNAKSSMKHFHEKLQPYVMEAALRGLDVSMHLQLAYGRSEKVASYAALNMLKGITDDEDEDEDFQYGGYEYGD